MITSEVSFQPLGPLNVLFRDKPPAERRFHFNARSRWRVDI